MSILLVIILFWAAAEIACLIALETIRLRTGIYFLPRNRPVLSAVSREFYRTLVSTGGTGTINELHADLGWAMRKNLTDRAGAMLTTRGRARSNREFEAAPAPGKVRIATFGDCLTFGIDVPVTDTWQSHIMQAEPACEVLNFGTEGYDAGQMYLNYLRSLTYYSGHRVVVFSLVSSNIFKPLNTFRLFYAYDHGLPLGKPGFRITEGRLERIPNPLTRLADYEQLLSDPAASLYRAGENDQYFIMTYRQGMSDLLTSSRLIKILVHEYRKYREVFDWHSVLRDGSTAFEVSAAIYDAMATAAKKQGAIPLILLLPLEREIVRYRKKGVKPYQSFIDRFTNRSLHSLDLLDEIGKYENSHGPLSLYAKNHFTPSANAFIASCVLRKIRSLGIAPTGSGR